MPVGSPWILPMAEGTAGPRVAVKDLIDVAGTPTTAGCAAVADVAGPAALDAACLSGLRAAVGSGRARLAGKATLDELALGVTGTNDWFGTPANPVGAGLAPGGSSSGCAAAVASGAADLAVGSDTGGSVRIPAACCGVAGLKTTTGRIPTGGVWPLAPSLDTVGPLARHVAGIVAAMQLLDPSFDGVAARAPWVPSRLGRPRPALPLDPVVHAAVDAALAALGVDVVEVRLPGWVHAVNAGLDLLGTEAARLHGALVRAAPDRVGRGTAAALAHAAGVGHQRHRDARAYARRWATTVAGALAGVDALVLPTIGCLPPSLGLAAEALSVAWTLPVNLAGVPALAVPIRTAAGPPASLQLVGLPGSEELLCRIGAAVEAVAGVG